MANKKNKVKFGLTNVHYAKINDWVTDASGANLTPVYVDPVRLPGAVSISMAKTKIFMPMTSYTT